MSLSSVITAVVRQIGYDIRDLRSTVSSLATQLGGKAIVTDKENYTDDTRTVANLRESNGTSGSIVLTYGGLAYDMDLTQSIGEPYLTTAGGVKIRPRPVDGVVTASQCGLVKGVDQTAAIQKWLQWATDNGYVMDFGGNEYQIAGDVRIIGGAKVRNGSIYSTKTVAPQGNFQTDVAFEIKGTEVADVAVVQDFEVGDDRIVVADATGIEVGTLIHLYSTRLIDTDHRGLWFEGQIVRVREVKSTTLYLDAPLCYSGRASRVVNGTITGISADRYTLNVTGTLPGNGRDRQCRVEITSGSGAGESRYALASGTNTMRHSGANAGEYERYPWPDSVQVGDTYRHAWESTATVVVPAKGVEIKNMTFRRDMVLDGGSDGFSFRGLRIEYADSPLITDCTINNFAMTNVHLSKSFRPTIRDCDVSGANLSFNEYSGTGYGVSIETCSAARVDNVWGTACRRIVDYSGAGGYSERGVCNAVTAYGGGRTYANERYYPNGIQRQSVAGSHGSGRFTTYSNCKGVDVYVGMNLRGRGEIVHNYTHFGCGENMVSINFGSGHTIDGLTYDDQFTEEARSADFRHVTSTRAGKRMVAPVMIDWSEPMVGMMMTTIRNVRAKSVSTAGIVVQGTGADIRYLVLSNWDLTISSEETDRTTFEFLLTSSSASLGECWFNDIRIHTGSDGYYSGYTALFGIPTQHGIREGEMIQIDDNWIGRVPQNGVMRVPCRRFVALVDLFNVRTGLARPRAIGVLVQDGTSAVLSGSSELYKMDILTGKQTSGSGVTSGNMGLSLSAADAELYVINNTGGAQTFCLNVR